MRYRRFIKLRLSNLADVTERREPKGYPPFEIHDLDGYFCKECGDGFWTRTSEQKIAAASAEHRA